MQKKVIKTKFLGQALLSWVVLPLVLLGFLFVSYPSKAGDGDTTSTSSSTSSVSTSTSSAVVDTTTTTTTNPVSSTTEITNTETTIEDLGAGITEQTTVDTHTTTNVDDVTTTVTDTIDTTTVTTTTTTTTTNTTTENHTPNQSSNNYLNNKGFNSSTNSTSVPNWTTDGGVYVCDTCGPKGGNALKTGNETTSGGSVSQTVDLFDQMTQEEVNHGFTINYGADVNSHSSNATVPLCSATNGDCKDSFSITLTIKDSSGTTLHNFNHEFSNISWTGWNRNDFFFNSTVPSNNYTSSLATLRLYGIDAGYQSGYFGPIFDNAIVQTVYTAIDFVVSQTVDTIIDSQTNVVRSYAVNSTTNRITTVTNEDISTVVTIVNPVTEIENPTSDLGVDIVEVEVETNMEDMSGGTEIETFEVTVSDNSGATIETFEVTTETSLDTGITEISIEPIEVDMPSTTTETVAEVETQIEQQVEAQVEEIKAETTPSGMKPNSQQAEAEPEQVESTSEPENPEAEQKESSNKTETAKADKKDQGEKVKAKATAKNKEEVKKEVATRIVSRIISKLSDDAASQGTQLALMNIIGADLTKNSPNLKDREDWYINPVIYTAELRDPYAKLFNIAQDKLHEQLTDLQYN